MKKWITVCLAAAAVSSYAQTSGWLSNMALAQSVAKANNKLILVDFWATWCGPCKKMDMEVWSTDEAAKIKQNFIPLKIDIDAETALATKYGIRSIPNLILMDYKGQVIHSYVGYSSKQDLLRFIENIPADAGKLNGMLGTDSKEMTFAQLRDLGLAYQNLSKAVAYPSLQRSFISQSEQSFKKALKKAGSDTESKEVELWSALGSVIRGSGKKVRAELLETKAAYSGTPNEALMYYVLLCACKSEADTEGYQSALASLKALPNSTALAQLAEE